MKTVLKHGLAALALTVAFSVPAHAQAVTQASVVAACSVSANACIAAQNGYVAALRAQGLSPAQVSAAVGTLVSALVSSPSVPPAIIAAAANNAVQYASSPAQAAAFTQIATVVSSGGTVPQNVLQVASAASPN
ncbi:MULTISPECIES: hypothetical protein [unclassified Devosia]|uniref:hypothetical protein n=1 Tax=unclassified Devosia TaxID=196773 RepID=UPI00145E752B|nr:MULTISPECIES: hypothetical protein [unclassified Devosia]MBJ6989222.1 hypothetical protein [Devosia sp. MC521]QMW63342.1 hypothetical protein H4N61_03105 [Devosia sp. MC521]